jgi:hypothetical protein
MCKKDYETEEEASAQQKAVKPLMSEWMNERLVKTNTVVVQNCK